MNSHRCPFISFWCSSNYTSSNSRRVTQNCHAVKDAKDTPAPKGPEVSPDELQGSTPAASPNPEEFERPEDILKEPVLSEPSLAEPRLTEPRLAKPQANAAPEPVTDEPSDEIIEIVPN